MATGRSAKIVAAVRPRRDRDRDRGRPATTTGPSAILGLERRAAHGNKEPDPNSPFAKLLALKEQLEGNKER